MVATELLAAPNSKAPTARNAVLPLVGLTAVAEVAAANDPALMAAAVVAVAGQALTAVAAVAGLMVVATVVAVMGVAAAMAAEEGVVNS